MALAEDLPELGEPRLPRLAQDLRHDRDTSVLALDVAHPARVAGLELASPLRVAGLGELTPHPRVDDQQRDPRRQRDRLVLERAGVEQDCVPGEAEYARALVEDPTGDADRAQLRALAGERELEGLQLEPGNGAEREADGDLERGRG